VLVSRRPESTTPTGAPSAIEDLEGLHAHFGEPGPLAARKVIGHLDRHCRAFIAASPFLVLASADADGSADASPRGDAPGFVAVLGDRTLLVPDRPGNRRVDSFANIVANPRVGLLFLVPGVNETLRVNGRARIVTDTRLLEPLSVRGRPPVAGLLVEVEEAFLHCAKALVRSDLWNPEHHRDRRQFPTLGRILAEQVGGIEADEAEQQIQESLRDRLY
jgi:PPOX class probable FMN-dependent enzyme